MPPAKKPQPKIVAVKVEPQPIHFPKTEKLPPETAPDFLENAIDHMINRAALRDSPTGERSMAKTVAAFNVIHGTALTEVQGWQFMQLLKIVRSSQGQYVADDYEDAAAYAALAGEAARKEANISV